MATEQVTPNHDPRKWWDKVSGWQVVTIVVIATIAWVIVQLMGCTGTHAVTQSAATSQYKHGDTMIINTTIRYEQIGGVKK